MMKEILFEGSRFSSTEDIILGKFAVEYGIHNYCYPDWYSWPVFEDEHGFAAILKKIYSLFLAR